MKWVWFSILIGAQIVFSVFVRAQDWTGIESVLEKIPFPCPVKTWFHIQCAFCGMTHSVISFYKGEWAQAFHYNTLVFGLVGFLNGVFFIPPLAFEKRRILIIAALVVGVLFMILRNIF